MDIITEQLKEDIVIPNEIKHITKDNNFCFFDIETTGFNRKLDSIILIGVLYKSDDQVILKQFFANNVKEEKELLLAFLKFTLDFNLFITYNGDAFDIPFINSKANSFNFELCIDKTKSLDLLKVVKKNKSLLNFEDHKLKTVEKALGIYREDKISGKESVALYNNYQITKNESLKSIILKHNYDDIYYLPKVLKVFDLIKEKNSISFNTSFNNGVVSCRCLLSDTEISENLLYINANTDRFNYPSQVYFGENYTLKWHPPTGKLEVVLQIYEGKLSNKNVCAYLNKNDFPFIENTYDRSLHTLPDNLILVREKRSLVLNNLRSIIEESIANLLSNL